MAYSKQPTELNRDQTRYTVVYHPLEEVLHSGARALGSAKTVTLDNVEEKAGLIQGIDQDGRELVLASDDRDTIWVRYPETDHLELLGVQHRIEEVA